VGGIKTPLLGISRGDTMKDMRKKKAIGVRFTLVAKELVEKLAVHLGVTKTAVIEMAIREKAKRDGISWS